MAGAQDDARERQMRDLFNLQVPPDRKRAGLDAHLEMPDHDDPLPFELKSTTRKSISTVRDLGPDHIAKWRHLHWLFAFYDGRGEELQYCIYASPADMKPWVDLQESYIRPDLVLAERAPSLITDSVLTDVVGSGEVFTKADARAIMKNQWSAAEYRSNADLAEGNFSRARMLMILQRRAEYVLRRGATLNNRHISARYLEHFERITKDYAATLRRLVQGYLDEAATTSGGEPPEGHTDPVVQRAATDMDQE